VSDPNSQTPSPAAANPETSSAQTQQGPSAPEYVGRYRLISRIARGGMAEIYLASERGLAGFERLVVIKRILSHLSDDPSFIEMFLREARIIARLNHPNIVHIHELAEENGDYFIAMEYIRGCSVKELQAFCASHLVKMPLAIAVSVTMEACRGAHAAHELRDEEGRLLGLVHRDISPHNLMINDAGVVKLLDFGVAKTTSAGEATFSGSLKGKFAYMSPEQVRGDVLDRRSDVFALGIMLWELCTDRSLFGRPSEMETMRIVSQAAIPKPSEIDDTIPPVLEAVILKALARDLPERYPSAEALRAALTDAARVCGFDTGTDMLAGFVQQMAGEEITSRHQRLLEGQGEMALSVVSRRRAAMQRMSGGAFEPAFEPATVSARPGTSPGLQQPMARTSVPAAVPTLPTSRRPSQPFVSSGLPISLSSTDIPIVLDEFSSQADTPALTSGSIDIPITFENQTQPEIPSLKLSEGRTRSADFAQAVPVRAAPLRRRLIWAGIAALVVAISLMSWWLGKGTPDMPPPAALSPSQTAMGGKPLLVGWPPTFKTELLLKEIEPLRLYLERGLQRPVIFTVSPSYQALSSSVRQGDVAFAMLTPLLMVKTTAVDPGVTPVVLRTYDHAKGSDAYLIVRQTPEIQGIEDLSGKRFCFTDPNSTSGAFLPKMFIAQRGFDPDRFIGAVHWSGDHFQVLRDLIADKCDAAALFSGAWINADRQNIPISQLRMLAVTGFSPQDTICAAPTTSPEDIAALKALLLAFDPKLVTPDQQDRLGDTQRLTGFVEPEPSLFNSLRAAQNTAWSRDAAAIMRRSVLTGSVHGAVTQ
jgi:phosphate/phosphite/phosphonate ABC transporter binding protein